MSCRTKTRRAPQQPLRLPYHTGEIFIVVVLVVFCAIYIFPSSASPVSSIPRGLHSPRSRGGLGGGQRHLAVECAGAQWVWPTNDSARQGEGRGPTPYQEADKSRKEDPDHPPSGCSRGQSLGEASRGLWGPFWSFCFVLLLALGSDSKVFLQASVPFLARAAQLPLPDRPDRRPPLYPSTFLPTTRTRTLGHRTGS
jgi:hypothetical protein